VVPGAVPGTGRWCQVLTIGEFARASRLSAKALRLYDELGLLPPAHVDPVSGYRFYAPDQLERARLVAWLRRLGMPLARIRHVIEAGSAAAAAAEVAAFWAQAEADHASRRDLAAFLTRYLNGEEALMTSTTLAIRYAAASDIGRQRPANQDTAYAGARLLAVADGMGGAGDLASAAAVEALKPLEAALPPGDLLNALQRAVQQADAAVAGLTAGDPARAGSGTTLTALLWAGSQLALVHIGDTRAYLLREGQLYQITHDHTVVQSMIDDGRLTPAEAASHPQRAMLLRALDGAATEVDLSLHDARAGDRYLLCSDGLTAVVPEEAIRGVLAAAATPGQVVSELITAANERGGPDNIACAAADLVPAA
jgi:serine/threonine protein phosphatase PrpC